MRREATMASSSALRTRRPEVAAGSRSTSSAARRRSRARKTLGRVGTHLGLLAISAFALAPLAWAISSAFKSDTEIMTNLSIVPSHPTLEHFKVVLRESNFGTWFLNSLLVSFGTTFLAIVVGSLAGYAMSRWRFRGRGLYGNSLL